jgi:hypothetical protein
VRVLRVRLHGVPVAASGRGARREGWDGLQRPTCHFEYGVMSE